MLRLPNRIGLSALPKSRIRRTIAMASNAQLSSETSKSINSLSFDNQTLQRLNVDDSFNNARRTVRGANFSLVKPQPVQNPRLVLASKSALSLLDLDLSQVESDEFAEYMSGNKLIPGAQPAAHCYCGYQFGYFSGQLGDGAAMYLGEVVNHKGERWELQFKGAGLTPYSRSADGRKVLRSSLREFLCSEAMHNLGIPTTRAGTCVTSDTKIVRDPLYDGNAIQEPATIITRIAQTFVRFGSFEIFKPTDSMTGRTGSSAGMEEEMLPKMIHFSISQYFPELWSEYNGDQLKAALPRGNEEGWHPLYAAWYKEVVRRTASLVAGWQSVGWCHGVLNTDNMSLLGLTIDYGPFGFMDAFNPDHICNGSDDSGRYTYRAQPEICKWNCAKFAEAIKWALPERLARTHLPTYDEEYKRVYMRLMRSKLGLLKVADAQDEQLLEELLEVMADTGADFSNTFRVLARFPLPPGNSSPPSSSPAAAATAAALSSPAAAAVLQYLVSQCAEVAELVKMKGPIMPPMNLQMLSMLASKDPQLLHSLGFSPQDLNKEMERLRVSSELRAMTTDEKKAGDQAAWERWLQRYAERLAAEVAAGAEEGERTRVMNATNPRFVLRNWIAQEVIEAAEKGDYGPVRELMALLEDPFTSDGEEAAFERGLAGGEGAACASRGTNGVSGADDAGGGAPSAMLRYGGRPPQWAKGLCVTCSS